MLTDNDLLMLASLARPSSNEGEQKTIVLYFNPSLPSLFPEATHYRIRIAQTL
jgi:hypothetical protein